jgi:hypothetical protein
MKVCYLFPERPIDHDSFGRRVSASPREVASDRWLFLYDPGVVHRSRCYRHCLDCSAHVVVHAAEFVVVDVLSPVDVREHFRSHPDDHPEYG